MNLIRIDDDTDRGGKVETGSQTMQFDGRHVACKGDRVSCEQHPDVSANVIEGDTSLTDAGVPIVRHGGLGPNTIKAINAAQDQDQLLQDIAEIRRKYYKMLVDNDSSQVVFLNDWLGRVDDCLQVKL